MCVEGPSNIGDLDSVSTTTIDVFGTGGLRLDIEDSSTPNLVKIDGHGLVGFLVLDIGSENNLGGAITILMGSGGSRTELSGHVADNLTDGAGPDEAQFTVANNIFNTTSSTGTFDAQAIVIQQFDTAHDSIDLTLTSAYSGTPHVFILSGSQNAATESQASLLAAANLAISFGQAGGNNAHIDAFTYTVSGTDSTYVILDNNHNNHVNNGDGLIKIAGVLGVTAADFV
jgi:hypothetical protein